MIDAEVERLRHLRGSALRLRAVARALGGQRRNRGDGLLHSGACAAWRLARTVSGRLRAHPNERCQQDAGVGTLIANGLTATVTALITTSRPRALAAFAVQLRLLMRELDDARALTWATDFSDTLGRSQREVRMLLDQVDREFRQGRSLVPAPPVRRVTAATDEESRFLTI